MRGLIFREISYFTCSTSRTSEKRSYSIKRKHLVSSNNHSEKDVSADARLTLLTEGIENTSDLRDEDFVNIYLYWIGVSLYKGVHD